MPALEEEVLKELGAGTHPDEASLLGPHEWHHGAAEDPVTTIRVLAPGAYRVVAEMGTGARIELHHVGHGVWQSDTVLRGMPYRVEYVAADGISRWTDNPKGFGAKAAA